MKATSHLVRRDINQQGVSTGDANKWTVSRTSWVLSSTRELTSGGDSSSQLAAEVKVSLSKSSSLGSEFYSHDLFLSCTCHQIKLSNSPEQV